MERTKALLNDFKERFWMTIYAKRKEKAVSVWLWTDRKRGHFANKLVMIGLAKNYDFW